VDDGLTSRRGLVDGREVEQVPALGEIEADHYVAAALEQLDRARSDVAAVPGDKDAHRDRIALAGGTRRNAVV
jgi:hypothetical protein